ncbi:MAG: cbb3-type cytochrome oxidase assembly protein CcoS [Hyphomonas sp.]
MSGLVFMIPIALIMGLAGLAAFLWAVRTGQFDDPDGASHRILISPDEPLPDETADKPKTEKPPPEFGG